MIAGLVLAAGGSTRMGRPKMLLPVPGGTLLSSAVRALLDAPLDSVVVVLGHAAERIRREAAIPEDRRVRILVNDAWAEGMSSSLKLGVSSLSGADAVAVVLGDEAGLTPGRVRRVVAAWSPGRALVVPVAAGVPSHPVLFGRALFAEIAELSEDSGGRSLVERHRAEAVILPEDPLPDIDTPEDYERLLER